MKQNIPNILTVSRLIAVLLLGIPYLIWDKNTASFVAFIIFAYAALTDFLDGYLARKWQVVSEFGRMLDPIADKALVLLSLAILAGLYGLGWLLVIPVSLIIFREVSVSGMREFLGDRAADLKVTNLAKYKTAAQLVSVGLMILGFAFFNDIVAGFGLIMLWIAAILTAITGVDYARKALALLEN